MRQFILAALLSLLPLAALAQPGYFRVVDVAADDTLNVRAEPSANSADIGDLPPDATAIEVLGTDPSGKWGQIVWQEGNAWIAMRFLAPDTIPQVSGTALPAGLLCTGTEPFWTVSLSTDFANYSNLDGDSYAMMIQGARVADGHMNFPVQVGFSGSGGSANMLISPDACSDGMSDRTYPWRIDLLLSGGGSSRYQVGCCLLPLEVGYH